MCKPMNALNATQFKLVIFIFRDSRVNRELKLTQLQPKSWTTRTRLTWNGSAQVQSLQLVGVRVHAHNQPTNFKLAHKKFQKSAPLNFVIDLLASVKRKLIPHHVNSK